MTLDDADLLGPWAAGARAVGEGWLSWNGRADFRPHGVDALVAEAQAAGEPRLRWLSLAWEAIVLSRRAQTQSSLARIEAIGTELRAHGWRRAIWLAEAALALSLGLATADRHDEILRRLDAHDPGPEQERPPLEQAWSAHARCVLKAREGCFDEALHYALAAERLAMAAGNERLQAVAANGLAFLFLSVGDVEGALNALPRCVAAFRRTGLRSSASTYNLMLALLLDRRPLEVLALAQAEPWLFDPVLNDRCTSACWLRAAAHAAAGELDAARDWLARARGGEDEGDHVQFAVLANRAWLTGGIYLALGEPVRARENINALLARTAATSPPLSPMNGTQLMRVLGDACEALGDLPGALAAFKRSQAYCFHWVADSMRARLQALQLEGVPSVADERRNAARLHALDHALDSAMAGSGSGDATAASTPPETESARANRPRDSRHFVAEVSHEMRNPLNGVIGMTSLLMLSELDEQQRHYVQIAQSSAQMLMALCNDILDLAKMDAGRFELRPTPVDPARLVREVVQTFEPLAQARHLALRCLVDTALPDRVEMDALRLQQVLMNLVSNAIKFTVAGSVEVDVRWRVGSDAAAAGLLVVAVHDTGPGLDALERARLFQEFVQLGTAAAQREGGTGLGLVLCRRLVGLMGGSLEVESAKSQGSTFRFALPLRRTGDALAA